MRKACCLPQADNHLSRYAKRRGYARMRGMDTVLPTIGRLIWRWIEFHGLSAGELFAEQGLAESDFHSVRDRIAVDKLDLVLMSALNRIGDNCCGLRAARCWHPSDLGALGYAWLASSSLRTAVRRFARYSKIVGERATVVDIETPRGLKVILEQKPRDARVRELIIDSIMSMMLDMSRFNAGKSLAPIEVRLKRSRPDCAARYAGFYDCAVEFSSDEDSFTLAARDVDRALPTSNKQLAGLHDQVLAQQLSTLVGADIKARCQAIILDNLTSGDISVKQMAKELHMTPRTLTRRLESHGTSVKVLVDEARSELASRYLADGKTSITEVAFLLGFSQASSLSRASNRWFGMSPMEYRLTHTGESVGSN